MKDSYTKGAILLHWLIAALLIGQLAFGFIMGDIPKEQEALRFQLYQMHKSVGITILLLTIVRLAWRIMHPPPPFPPGMAAWEKASATVVHVGFYVLLAIVPLLGWAYVSASPFNVPTVLFGVVHLPHLPFFADAPDRKAIAELLEESHEIAAKLVIALLILHVGAALKHHFVNKDTVLARMAPVFRRKS